MNLEDAVITPDPKESDDIVIVQNKLNGKEYKGCFYSSTGFVLNTAVTKSVPKSQVFGVEDHGIWNAPDEIGGGSLFENHQHWGIISDNIESVIDLQGHHDHRDSNSEGYLHKLHHQPHLVRFRDYLKTKLSYELSLEFYKEYNKELNSRKHCVTEEESLELMVNVFERIEKPYRIQSLFFRKEIKSILSRKYSLQDKPDIIEAIRKQFKK